LAQPKKVDVVQELLQPAFLAALL